MLPFNAYGSLRVRNSKVTSNVPSTKLTKHNREGTDPKPITVTTELKRTKSQAVIAKLEDEKLKLKFEAFKKKIKDDTQTSNDKNSPKRSDSPKIKHTEDGISSPEDDLKKNPKTPKLANLFVSPRKSSLAFLSGMKSDHSESQIDKDSPQSPSADTSSNSKSTKGNPLSPKNRTPEDIKTISAKNLKKLSSEFSLPPDPVPEPLKSTSHPKSPSTTIRTGVAKKKKNKQQRSAKVSMKSKIQSQEVLPTAKSSDSDETKELEGIKLSN